MNRRQFMGSTAAGAALAFAGPSVVAANSRGVVLFDARYGDSRAFAAELARQGFQPLATNQDVVRLWYESAALRTAVRVAGVTPHSDLEIVRRLLKEKRKALALTSFRAVRANDRPGSLFSWHLA